MRAGGWRGGNGIRADAGRCRHELCCPGERPRGCNCRQPGDQVGNRRRGPRRGVERGLLQSQPAVWHQPWSEHQHRDRPAAERCRRRQRRRPGCLERQDGRARRRWLFRESEPDRGGQRRIRRLRQRSGAQRGRLRAGRESGRQLQRPVHRRLHPQRHQAASSMGQESRRGLLRHGARLQLLERLLDRWPAGLPARAGARGRARWHPGKRPGHVLDAVSNGADVGPNRDERAGRWSYFGGQARAGRGLGRGRMRCGRWRYRRRDRRSALVPFQRPGQYLRRRSSTESGSVWIVAAASAFSMGRRRLPSASSNSTGTNTTEASTGRKFPWHSIHRWLRTDHEISPM